MRIAVAAAGNADENINVINARFQAEALRQLRGYDTGVLVNSFFSSADPTGEKRDQNSDFMWKLTASTVSDIAVGRGMATAYGFDIQSEETVHLTATAPSAGSKYLFIYLEWDFSNPEEAFGKIDIRDNGSSSSWTPSRRDNLITNPIGAYQMVLYRLQVNTAGRITATTKWSELGVASIECPLFSTYSRDTTNAKFAEYAKGKTDKTIAGWLNDIYDRLAKLGFKEGSVSLASGISATQNSVTRQGNYVIGAIKGISGISIPSRDRFGAHTDTVSVGTLPANFRPKGLSYGGAVCPEKQDGARTSYVGPTRIEIATDGKITVISWYSGGREPVEVNDIYFGFEADPI